MKRAIVIPAYNEEKCIHQTVLSCRPFADTILVANDGSVDETSSIAKAAGAVVLDLPHKGCGAAVASAFHWALEQAIDCVICLDADMAYNPEEITLAFAEHQRQGADLTIGSRFVDDARSALVPSQKRWANYFASYLVNVMAHANMSDVACGLRVLGTKAMQLNYELPGFGIAYEQIISALIAGLKIIQVPVNVHYDAGELLCTQRNELVDLLDACLKWSRQELFNRLVAQLKENVLQGKQTVCLNLGTYTAENTVLYLHYLPHVDAYIFQRQDPYLNQIPVDSRVCRIDFPGQPHEEKILQPSLNG